MNARKNTSRGLAMATLAAITLGGVLLAAPANAATSGTVKPDSCPAGGPYFDFTQEGESFHQVSPEYTDYNGTGGVVTDSFTNTASGTVTTTVTATLSISISGLVADANSSLSASYESAQTVSTGHTVTYNVPSHEYGHAEYGDWQEILNVEQYNETNSCGESNEIYATAYMDNGIGWDLWTATS